MHLKILVGECHANGTRKRNVFGGCVCNPGYAGDACDHCRKGTKGDNCDYCEDDYIKKGPLCIKGECKALGTYNRTEDGVCTCKGKFQGTRCDECLIGSVGAKCDICDDGYYKAPGDVCLGILLFFKRELLALLHLSFHKGFPFFQTVDLTISFVRFTFLV